MTVELELEGRMSGALLGRTPPMAPRCDFGRGLGGPENLDKNWPGTCSFGSSWAVNPFTAKDTLVRLETLESDRWTSVASQAT